MRVLSLFDGIACAYTALKRAGFRIEKYYASEIDKYAMAVAKKNYPDIVQVGDVRELKGEDFKNIDLLIGGSPCTGLSIARQNREGLKDKQSCLFFEMVRLHKAIKLKWFLYENVASMAKDQEEIISKTIADAEQKPIELIYFDAALVSAQSRKRLFWTNIRNVEPPEDKGILLKDILEDGVPAEYSRLRGVKWGKNKSTALCASDWRGLNRNQNQTAVVQIASFGKNRQAERIYSVEGKSVSLRANAGGQGAKCGLYLINRDGHTNRFKRYDDKCPTLRGMVRMNNVSRCVNEKELLIRKLSPVECERLQGCPDGYTAVGFDGDKEIQISNTQRYKCLGNAFNVDVVAHILKYINGRVPQGTLLKNI